MEGNQLLMAKCLNRIIIILFRSNESVQYICCTCFTNYYEIFERTHSATPVITSTMPPSVHRDVGSPSNDPNRVVNRKVRELVMGTARVMSALPIVM